VLTGIWDRLDLARNDDFDAIPITMDFGDLRVRNPSVPVLEFDEVFGNEFVKEDKKREKIDPQTGEDSRIAGAVNPFQANVSPPVDLNPEILPDYPPAARAAGVQGTVTLELVVSDEGEVLRAKPVGKPLGLGLDGAASAAFMKKRYKPSVDREGKAFTVKFYQPVRFVLN
jgi:protein TonB